MYEWKNGRWKKTDKCKGSACKAPMTPSSPPAEGTKYIRLCS